uniref:MAM domain containing glycosylphosphatidylinositol anchor 1 n=1 Tax=Oncorhynchus kisutch TaxID=8019 RepID=A0A8C7FE08_ONCKI
MELFWILVFSIIYPYARGQGVYAPANAKIVHEGQACVVKDDNISERIYTIREGDHLVLKCLVKGHPRPQVRWTKTAGSASDKFQETSIYNETLRIEGIQRVQGGRYYCKADNGVGVAAIKSIRVDVQYLDKPVLTVHQTISDVRGSFYQEKTVFLRCTVNSNPPARFIWKRGTIPIEQSKDQGVDIYEPLYTQGETEVLKLKNLRLKDFANYTCQVSVRNVCEIPDSSVTFLLTIGTSMGNLTFQITPDSNKDSESIQMGRDLKLSCHVDAEPQDKVNYTWYQNAVLIYNSDSLIVLHSDPDMAPGTSSLEIVDMKFRDQATYSCVANFPGSTVPELRVDVNITQNSVTPPILTVPEGGQVVSVREGGTTDLVCLVDGKPRPPVLWSRADKDLTMPTGEWAVETRDGRLRLTNVTRDLMGAYRCQTAPYNGLNVKPRQAQVQLNVQYAPVLDPVFQDVRSPNYQFVTLRCIIQKSNPPHMASIQWTRNGEPLTSLTPNPQENPQLKFKLDPSNNGTYKCRVNNGVGSSTCTFNISSRPYNAEFYFDTPNPIRNLKGNNFSYNLQWTQREPVATDRIIGYWVNVRNNEKMNQMNLFSKQIDKEPVKGGLMSYILTDLKILLSYEISLAPITTYSTGDYVSRTIKYSEPYNYPRPSDNVCGFEDKHICGFSQDRGDNFDWTRQNHLTQNPKRSSNTGPEMDRSGTKEGCYMYIEASSPRVPGDTARLLSPLYNVTAARGPKGSGHLPYCISFFYHMKGKQTGTLDVWLRVKSIASVDTKVWSLIGNQGPDWNQANIIVNPSGPFQVVFQAIRGSGYEGDIAIDDVSVTKGKCKQENSVSNTVLIGGAPVLCSQPLAASLTFALCSYLLLLYR